MQTAAGRTILMQHGVDPDDPVTFLLVDDGAAYTDTDAALRVVSRFGIGWRIFASIVRVIPSPLGTCFIDGLRGIGIASSVAAPLV
jgi:predicted DCC family thiol-disulfide oxidoreductase YuxK